MWLLRFGIIVVAIVCFIIGPLAAYKGFRVLKSGKSVHAGLAVRALLCGTAVFLLGAFLVYTLFTF